MLDKLFGWGKKKESFSPAISFGRYSDNNKTVAKVDSWTQADNLFKEKRYRESIDNFFFYLRDDQTQNVVIEPQDGGFRFSLYQGSKMVRGFCDSERLVAEVTLARMEQASVPVMRRLLEQNFILYYSRYALDGDRLCMKMDTPVTTASPNKLYYGLKELATRADKQDDLLVQDFNALQVLDTEHVEEIPLAEKEVKYTWMMRWIKETVDLVESLDTEKFSGGIAYFLLCLIYRIDYLVCPEGKMLHELELINGMYYTREEKPVLEKNRNMLEAFKKLMEKSREEVFPHLFRSRSTFAIVAPQVAKTISDAIYNANQNMIWYRDNNHPHMARQITEYGLSFCQFSYSLPRPMTELYHLFMMVNYADYFIALGFSDPYYDSATNKFSSEAIIERINQIISNWVTKYPKLAIKTDNLKFDNMVNFNQSLSAEMEYLNFDVK